MKVLKGSSGQILVTIPKALASSMDMKPGETVTWRVIGKNRLELVKE